MLKVLILMFLLSGCSAKTCLPDTMSKAREARQSGLVSDSNWSRIGDVYYSDLPDSSKCLEIDNLLSLGAGKIIKSRPKDTRWLEC